MAEHEQLPTSDPCTQGITIFLAIFLFAYLCLFVLGCCKPILAWQRPPYHVLLTGQVITLCNISYFSARGYTLTFTHIHLGEAGYPKLTMGIFGVLLWRTKSRWWTAEAACAVACVCRGSPGQNTPHIFPLPQLPVLSRPPCVWHPSFPTSSPFSKPPSSVPSSSLKPGEAWDACPLPQAANFPQ